MRGATRSTNLSRFFDTAMTTDPPTERPGPLASSWVEVRCRPASSRRSERLRSLAAAIGQRLAELHAAFSQAGTAAASRRRDVRTGTISTRLAERAKTAWERGRAALTSQPPPSDAAMAIVDAARRAITIGSWLVCSAPRAPPFPRALRVSRVHGTLDLAHVLIYEGDVLFIGPAEDPTESPEWRRRLETPLVDVASLLWSLQNAATRALAGRPPTSPADRDRLAALVTVVGGRLPRTRSSRPTGEQPSAWLSCPDDAETHRHYPSAVAVRTGVR